ncbi:DUF805 domain-containing protein [Maridesulfovibrio sp.]|uniref:DUF805 domain-containing protein n=1 Tax=Maridesulfovibrio sp. TaxID=2795000 RepID=UPI002A18AA82|nr:DUF805 domain-containing protein [Maridesulfovibrio sp.]
MKYYIELLKKFNDFQGNASRREFVHFILFHCGIIAVLLFLGFAIEHPFAHKVINTVSGLFVVGTSLSCVALFVRRMNALGRNPKLLFVALIPVLGWLYLLFICLKKV